MNAAKRQMKGEILRVNKCIQLERKLAERNLASAWFVMKTIARIHKAITEPTLL